MSAALGSVTFLSKMVHHIACREAIRPPLLPLDAYAAWLAKQPPVLRKTWSPGRLRMVARLLREHERPAAIQRVIGCDPTTAIARLPPELL